MIKAELLLASHNKLNGKTLYTFKWTFPRIILAEVNTHRILSKNTASSRAIPSKKFRSKVLDCPFIPTSIGEYQSGMQAGKELDGWRRVACEKIYSWSRYPQVAANYLLEKLGAHKQVQNRLLEPWMWVEQIVSGTEWQNFINLRAHPAAEPHIQELTHQVKFIVYHCEEIIKYGRGGKDCKYNLIITRDPNYLHVPLISNYEYTELSESELLDISAARCARVSYYLPDSTKPSNIEKDRELIKKLSGSNPKHLSPFEHQAYFVDDLNWYGNFQGWKQYRKTIPGEDGNFKL